MGYVDVARDLRDGSHVRPRTRARCHANLGRLNVSTATGDTDDDGDFDAIYAFGARSFSVWTDTGALVYDSGNELELRTAKRLPAPTTRVRSPKP